MGEKDRKEQQALLEEINKQFRPIAEFQEENQSLPEQVRIFGVGTTAFERFIGGPEVSFFIYPTGEKDGALFVLGTEEEMATLGIGEFSLDFKRSIIENPPEPEVEEDDDGDETEIPTQGQWIKSKELFEQWLNP